MFILRALLYNILKCLTFGMLARLQKSITIMLLDAHVLGWKPTWVTNPKHHHLTAKKNKETILKLLQGRKQQLSLLHYQAVLLFAKVMWSTFKTYCVAGRSIVSLYCCSWAWFSGPLTIDRRLWPSCFSFLDLRLCVLSVLFVYDGVCLDVDVLWINRCTLHGG